MRKTALFLALTFSALAPAAVAGGVFARPTNALVFDGCGNNSVLEPTVSAEDVEIIAGDMPIYMAPTLSNPVAELVFGSSVKDDLFEEDQSTSSDVENNTDLEYDDSVADGDLDKGFVADGVIDSSKPILQKPSGTLATGPFSPSEYKLTSEERDLVERVVMAEVSGKSYIDALAVAQCIYDRCMRRDLTVEEVIFEQYAFAAPTYRYEPTALVKGAVSDMFDSGIRLTVEPLYYFYATRIASPGAFHETQRCLLETDKHRYFGPW